MTRRLVPLLLALIGVWGAALPAQPLFASDEPIQVTLTTNLRDLIRERDSTRLQWFGAEMRYVDPSGAEQMIPVELRARGHFRRQSENCTFPPLFVRAERAVRDSSVLRGNPRVKLVTPCRANSANYQQFIFTEYQLYRTYELIDPVHHRTRLVKMTYVDSAGRMRPVEVMAFFLETADEVADEHEIESVEISGVTWEYIPPDVIDRISLFQYWIANTDWSVAGLHNIAMFRRKDLLFRPVAYDFDWTGAVNATYARPNTFLGLTSTRQRRHRGPCRTAVQWAPTVALFQSQRAAIDAIWSTPLPGQDARKLADSKRYLDELWPVLEDARRFKREILDECQPEGN
jgi:hypothetical protein